VVVGHHREFVGRHGVAPPDDEVPEIHARRPPHRAESGIVKLDPAAVGHAEPPGHVSGPRRPLPHGGPQMRRKDRLRVRPGRRSGDPAVGHRDDRIAVRRQRRLLDVAPRMGARIDEAGRLEPAPHLEIPARSIRLPIGGVRAADIGPLRPDEAEPSQVVDRGGRELLAAPRRIEILEPQHQPCGAGPGRGQRERAGMTEVQQAGRGGGEPTAAERRAWRHPGTDGGL